MGAFVEPPIRGIDTHGIEEGVAGQDVRGLAIRHHHLDDLAPRCGMRSPADPGAGPVSLLSREASSPVLPPGYSWWRAVPIVLQ